MSAQERGLTMVQPQAMQVGPDLQERRALLKNLIMRGGNDAQVDLVMHLCSHYGLDPLLKHIVLISGSVYITRDGLLHIAHASGNFDGIEVETTRGPDGEWAATCTIWRKNSNRPIRYTAFEAEHKPKNPGNSAWGQYPRAMLQKCAEVMALRRAFDVSLGAVEELGYDGESPQSSIGQVVTVTRPQAVEATYGEPRQIERESRDVPAAGAAVSGDEQEPMGWTEFWSWARARGLGDRKSLDATLGRPTSGMVPNEIARALLDVQAAQARQPVPEAQTKRREYSVSEKGDMLIAWLAKQRRTEDQQVEKVNRLFALSEDQQVLETWHALVTEHVQQDVRDLAWFNRMEALDRLHIINGQPIEAEATQAEMPPVSGEPGDDVPFD